MAAINWDENMSVKIDVIDEQHKKLISLINSFYDGLNSKKNSEKILEMIKGMKDYTIFHFSAEEKLLKQYGYPDYQNHHEAHQKFIESVKNFEERYRTGKFLLSLEVTNFIKDWIVNHIMGTDKQYAAFLIKSGVNL
jgi:hemerythrin-like metal-binding protein